MARFGTRCASTTSIVTLLAAAAYASSIEECRAGEGECSGDESGLLQHRVQSAVRSSVRPQHHLDHVLPRGQIYDTAQQKMAHKLQELTQHKLKGRHDRADHEAKKAMAFFEMCRPGDAFQRTEGASLRQEKTDKVFSCALPWCDLTTHMVIAQDTPFGVTEGCCPLDATYCAGCAILNASGNGCEVCVGGYTKIGGACTACIDNSGWTGWDNTTCWDANCSDIKVQGVSSNDACCKCGGGEQAATPFTYRASTVLLGSNFVQGGPVPRTATRYSLDDACELVKFGLTIDGYTGELKRANDTHKSSGLADMGTETFEVDCTITAQQTAYLNYSVTMSVKAGWFAYETFNNDGVLIGSNLQPDSGMGLGLVSTNRSNGTVLAQGTPCIRRPSNHRHREAGEIKEHRGSMSMMATEARSDDWHYSGTEIPLQNFAYMCQNHGNHDKSLCEFQLKCAAVQTQSWIRIEDAHGGLEPRPNSMAEKPGVTGFGTWNDQAGNPGGSCEVTVKHRRHTGFPGFPRSRRVREIKFSFPIVSPKIWPNFNYTVASVHTTVGEPSPPLYVQTPPGSDSTKTAFAKPSRFSIACGESPKQLDGRTSFVFDTVTGDATVNGRSAFTLDLTTGALRVHPVADVVHALDNLDSKQTRRILTLSCSVFAHYDTLEIGAPNPWVATPMEIELRDDTCWLEVTAKFLKNSTAHPHQLVPEATTEALCRSACRKDVVCTHFLWDAALSQCKFSHFRCAEDASSVDCDTETVQEKVTNCKELESCLRVDFGHHWNLGGWYCPQGDMQFNGVAYLRSFVTSEDQLWLAPFNPNRDAEYAPQCAEGQWMIRRPNRNKDFIDSSKYLAELNGEVLVCFDVGGDLTSVTLADGVVNLTIVATPNDASLLAVLNANTKQARIENPTCPSPNITEMMGEAESEAADDSSEGVTAVVPIVLDDPTTDTPDDHWMHPCSCFSPTNWGQNSPVTAESFEDVPAGSANQYRPAPFEIVHGEYTCEPGSASLIRIIILQDSDTQDFETLCEQSCRSEGSCLYYFSGVAKSTKQCRLYKECNVLVREVGIAGGLFGFTTRQEKVCRIADPDLCQQVSLRREFLGAPIDSSTELSPSPRSEMLYRSLTEQCDYKLLIGQMGINMCGKASYSFQSPDFWAGKKPPPEGKSSGVQLVGTCWDERYTAVPNTGSGPSALIEAAQTLTCLGGSWLGPNGELGLNGFACATCITVALSPYGTLQKQNKEELYFTPNKELWLYVMTNPPQRVNSSGLLEEAPIYLAELTDPVREAPPNIYGNLTNGYATSSVGKDICMGVQTGRVVDLVGDAVTIAVDVTYAPNPGTSETLDSFNAIKQMSAFGVLEGTSPNRQFTAASVDNAAYVTHGYSAGTKTIDTGTGAESEIQGMAHAIAYANIVGLPRVAAPWNQAAEVQVVVSSVTIGGTDYTNSDIITISDVNFGVGTGPWTGSGTFTTINGTVNIAVSVTYNAGTTVTENVFKLIDCANPGSNEESVNLGWHSGDPNHGDAMDPGPLLQVESGTYAGKCVSLTATQYAGSSLFIPAACDSASSLQKMSYVLPDDETANKIQLVDQADGCITAEEERELDWLIRLEDCTDNSEHRGDGALDRGVYIYNYAQDDWIMAQQDCWATTTVLVDCTKTCGGGYSTRSIAVFSPNSGLGQSCPGTKATCNMFACAESDGWLPDTFEGASIGFKHFRSTADRSKCLAFNATGADAFSVPGCDSEEFSQQLDSAQLPTVLWEIVRKNVDGGIPISDVKAVAKYDTVQQRKFLSDLELTKDCGDDAVVQEIRWGTWEGEPGFMVRCSAAVINAIDEGTLVSRKFPRADLIETKDGGFCMSATFNNLAGSSLSDYQATLLRLKLLALVELLKCDPDDASQRFSWSGKKIKNEKTGLCLHQDHKGGEGYLTLRGCYFNREWTYDERARLVNQPIYSDDSTCVSWMKAQKGEDTALKVAVRVNCMRSSADAVRINDGQTEYAQGLWRVGSGIIGLNGAEVQCDHSTASVLNKIVLTGTKISYKCTPLGAVGACHQMETPEVDTTSADLEGLERLDMNCSRGALMAFHPELAAGGGTFKYKYTCCDLTEPSALVPTGVSYTSHIPYNQGVYCANETRDTSGRLMYGQQSWFNEDAAAAASTHEFVFDHLEGQWCDQNSTYSSCLSSDNAVPTDTELNNTDWEVLTVTNFAYAPTPRGTAVPKTKKRKFPELIKFAAVQPEYARECQDDVFPGNTGFDLALMDKVDVQLTRENPCSLVGGVSAADSLDGEARGYMFEQANSAYTTDREQKFGVTYRFLSECSSRAIARSGEVWKTEMGFDVASQIRQGISDFAGLGCNAFPEPGLWFGFAAGNTQDWSPPNMCKKGLKYGLLAWKNVQQAIHMVLRGVGNKNGVGDCDPIQAGFARSACDLHCIREAIRSGTKAILASMEKSVHVQTENNRLMLEYYSGMVLDKMEEQSGDTTALLQQEINNEFSHAQRSTAHFFMEMKGLLSDSMLSPSGEHAVTRALDSFLIQEKQLLEFNTNRSKEDAGDHKAELAAMLQRVQRVHTVAKGAHKQRLGQKAIAERRMHSFLVKNQELLVAYNERLGRHKARADVTKHTQQGLMGLIKPSIADLQRQLETQHVEELLVDVDETWWELREIFDQYLKAADDHISTMQHSTGMMQEYTSQCSVPYPDFLQSFHQSHSDTETAKKVVKEAWAKALPLVGLLTSKLVDGNAFVHFARADMLSADVEKAMLGRDEVVGNFSRRTDVELLERSRSSLCAGTLTKEVREAAKSVIHSAAYGGSGTGLWSSMLQQVAIVLAELRGLAHWHQPLELGEAPDMEDADISASRLRASMGIAVEAQDELAEDALEAFLKKHCS